MLDEMLPRIRHKKLAVVVGVFVAGFGIGWLFFGRSMFTQVRLLEKERVALLQKMAVAQSTTDTEQKLMEYQARLTQEKKKGWFLEEVNSIAKDCGFTILAVEPQQRRELGNDMELLSVHIEADANFHELGEFVSRVENAKSLFKVVEVDISAMAGTDTENSVGGYATQRSVETRRQEDLKNKLYTVSLTIGVLNPMRSLVV